MGGGNSRTSRPRREERSLCWVVGFSLDLLGCAAFTPFLFGVVLFSLLFCEGGRGEGLKFCSSAQLFTFNFVCVEMTPLEHAELYTLHRLRRSHHSRITMLMKCSPIHAQSLQFSWSHKSFFSQHGTGAGVSDFTGSGDEPDEVKYVDVNVGGRMEEFMERLRQLELTNAALQEELRETQEVGVERYRHNRHTARREAEEVARQVADATKGWKKCAARFAHIP